MINILARGVLRPLVSMYLSNLIAVKVANGINAKKEILKEMRLCALAPFSAISISGRSALKILSTAAIIVAFSNKLASSAVNFLISHMEYLLVTEQVVNKI